MALENNKASLPKPSAHIPFDMLPQLSSLRQNSSQSWPKPPTDDECFTLWRKYAMLSNVERHSLAVAEIATSLAKMAANKGFTVDVASVRASALLHDLAKSYSLRHGGSHAQLGASWVRQETGHFGIAQGVLLHVHWPWDIPGDEDICTLPFFVIYADKRVKHDLCVKLADRFEDLLERYGKSEQSRNSIREAFAQAKNIEDALGAQLGLKLNEDSFDRRGLVA